MQTPSMPRLLGQARNGAIRSVAQAVSWPNQKHGGMAVLIPDTDLLTILFRGPPLERARLLSWLDQQRDEDAFITIISFEEQMRGWLAVISKAKTPERQSEGYARLGELISNFGELPVLAFDINAAERFGVLRREYRRHGAADLKIAAIAIANDATFLTRNIRDFRGIDELSVVNPLA